MAHALIDALRPVLHDVRVSGLPVSFWVRKDEVENPVPGIERAMLWASDHSGTSIEIDLRDTTAHQVVAMAHAVQDLVIEDFIHRPWPRCPWHSRGGHPLVPVVHGDDAVWACPTDNVRVASVGSLRGSPD